jgi:hypothetical protein
VISNPSWQAAWGRTSRYSACFIDIDGNAKNLHGMGIRAGKDQWRPVVLEVALSRKSSFANAPKGQSLSAFAQEAAAAALPEHSPAKAITETSPEREL